jgi:DNA ligase-1
MNDFVAVFLALGETTSSSQKVKLLADYFTDAPTEDLGWAVHLLRGEKIPKAVSSTQLRAWSSESSGYPLWLIEESYHVVGDLAETISKVVSGEAKRSPRSLKRWIELMLSLRELPDEERKRVVQDTWRDLCEEESLVFNKLITGGFRIGVSRGLVTKALSRVTGVEEAHITERLLAHRDPDTMRLEDLREDASSHVSATPYPFYLAYPLEGGCASLGEPSEWIAEWKWDGMRGQILRRSGVVAVWSRGEELVSESFPELRQLAEHLPEGTALDGEIVSMQDGAIGSFSLLQQRMNRKRVSEKLVASNPVGFVAYDLLEWQGRDIRGLPCNERRGLLKDVIRCYGTGKVLFEISDEVPFSSWSDLEQLRGESRSRGAEGFMLKRRSAPYGVGRKRGDWWKWKVDPLTVDGVLVYAQKGHGRRADLFTDYTFAVWREGELVPFAKAYSGLTDQEIREVDAFIKRHTVERFGPVRTVEPLLVFEIGFEGIQSSSRHKSGVAVRFPRILRWRRDKPATEADTVETLRALVS